MGFLAALALSYVLGAIPTGYVLVRGIKRMDIRTVGSGNIGATNALRAAGPWAGGAVLILDILKGLAAATLIPRALVPEPGPAVGLVCGAAAVAGHAYSCFLRFEGGKGVATTIGALLGASPAVAGCFLGVWAVVFALSRYVSLGSVAAAAAMPVSQIILRADGLEVLAGAVLATLIMVRHRANLQRLLAGTEHRAWSRKAH